MNRRFLSFILFVFISLSTFAQEGNAVVVEVSKEKTTINKKTYYLHTVKKGENLYRISLAYHVKQKDIIIANPEAISGNVKEGQILKIPVDPATPKSIQFIESDNFIYHITEEQQTLFFITQKYNITQAELYKYNPELEVSPLQVGQVVRIPKKENVSQSGETFHPIEDYTDHKVRRKETKYSISQQYNITVDELIAANPELNTQDLQAGSTIKIPVKSSTQFETKELLNFKDSLVTKSKSQVKDTVSKVVEPCNKDYKPFSQQFNVALLLPFSIEDNHTRTKLDSAAMANNPDRVITAEMLPRTVFALEFYEGFLLAVDSLRKAGLSVSIYPYDTERDVAKVNKILGRPEFKEMDLIIGPFFSEGLDKVNKFSEANGIKLVSPVITNNKALENNPFAFEVLPGDSLGVAAMVKFISKVTKKKVILVKTSSYQDTTLFNLFKKQLDHTVGSGYKTFVYKGSYTGISHLLVDSAENIVIVPSTDEVALMGLFAKLNIDSKKYKIKLMGLPGFASFKSIDQQYMHNLEVHYYTPFFSDYESPVVRSFVNKFQNKFAAPPQDFQKEGFNFAFLGYDIGFYFLSEMGSKGKSFENCLPSNVKPLHMVFDFARKNPQAGFVNHGVQILEFSKDYYIRKAD
ncbi:MAG TPA: LysM peptidoglycan-binding domain-containing protein [Bacteroidales bacterium]|nr:LysM peptidoglycan-binding domain-containing protein [Bacteroidales bacterium]